MGRLTTHVLDTANGCPGKAIYIKLFSVAEDGSQKLLKTAITNDDGRVDSPMLEGEELVGGTYILEFDAGDYYRGRGIKLADPAFLDIVPIRFGVADAGTHYHVPLLLSPYGYSTYRGS